MPNFGADNFEEIRKNMERIKKEEGIENGVNVNQHSGEQTHSTESATAPSNTPLYFGGGPTSDPTASEAYKRYLENVSNFKGGIHIPFPGIRSNGWGILHNIG